MCIGSRRAPYLRNALTQDSSPMFSPAEGFGELWFPIQPAKPLAWNTAVSMDWCLRVEETICFFSNVFLSIEASSHFDERILLSARLLSGLWAGRAPNDKFESRKENAVSSIHRAFLKRPKKFPDTRHSGEIQNEKITRLALVCWALVCWAEKLGDSSGDSSTGFFTPLRANRSTRRFLLCTDR